MANDLDSLIERVSETIKALGRLQSKFIVLRINIHCHHKLNDNHATTSATNVIIPNSNSTHSTKADSSLLLYIYMCETRHPILTFVCDKMTPIKTCLLRRRTWVLQTTNKKETDDDFNILNVMTNRCVLSGTNPAAKISNEKILRKSKSVNKVFIQN